MRCSAAGNCADFERLAFEFADVAKGLEIGPLGQLGVELADDLAVDQELHPPHRWAGLDRDEQVVVLDDDLAAGVLFRTIVGLGSRAEADAVRHTRSRRIGRVVVCRLTWFPCSSSWTPEGSNTLVLERRLAPDAFGRLAACLTRKWQAGRLPYVQASIGWITRASLVGPIRRWSRPWNG